MESLAISRHASPTTPHSYPSYDQDLEGIAMKLQRVAAAFCVILLIVLATAWVTAQVVAVKPVPPKVMTGADVGFRVEGIRGDTPIGVIVVKVNGEWVEADIAKVGTRSLQP